MRTSVDIHYPKEHIWARRLGTVFVLCLGMGAAYSQEPQSRRGRIEPARAEASPRRELRFELQQIELAIAKTRHALRNGKGGNLDPDTLHSLQDQLAELLLRSTDLFYALRDWKSGRGALTERIDLQVTRFGKNHWEAKNARMALKAWNTSQGFSETQRNAYEQALGFRVRAREMVQQGNDHHALLLEQRAYTIFFGLFGKKDPLFVRTMQNVAIYKNHIEPSPENVSQLEQVLEIWEDLFGKQHPAYTNTLSDLAWIHSTCGNLSQAEWRYQQALAIQKKILREKDPAVARSLDGLAKVYRAKQKYGQAVEMNKQALAIRQEVLGENHPDSRSNLKNLAICYFEMGRFSQALPLFETALEISQLQDGKNHPNTIQSLVNLGITHFWMGDTDHAERRLRQGLTRQLDSLQGTMIHQSEADATSQVTSSSLSSQLHRIISLWRILPNRDPAELYDLVWRSSGILSEKLALRQTAFRNGRVGQQFARDFRDVSRRMVRLLLEEPKTDERKTQIAAELRELDNYKERLEREFGGSVRAGAGTFPAVLASRPTRLPTHLWQILPANLAIVHFREVAYNFPPAVDSVREYEAFLVKKSDKEPGYTVAWLHLGSADEINRAVVAWLAEIEGGRGALGQFHRFLRKRVWDPLEPHLNNIDHIVLIPDSKLHFLPWGALPGKRAGTFLIEDYGISTALNGQQFFQQLLRYNDNIRQIYGTSFLAPALISVGGINYGSPKLHRVLSKNQTNDRQKWINLPGTKVEAESITDMWAQSRLGALKSSHRVYQGDDATEPALQIAMQQAQCIHLATHGFFDGSQYRSAVKSIPVQDDSSQPEKVEKELEAAKASVLLRNPLICSGLVLARANMSEKERNSLEQVEAMIKPPDPLQSIERQLHSGFPLPFRKDIYPTRDPLRNLAGLAPPTISPRTGSEWRIQIQLDQARNNQRFNRSFSASDGIMTAQEVALLDLRGTELVTLSACDTGRGVETSGGEGIYGLQRAFHLAGANHVVASLWKVDDEATVALMKLFYHHYLLKNEHPAVALRNAQLYVLHHPEEVSTIAKAPSRGLNLSKPVRLPDGGRVSKPKNSPQRTHAAIRLWAAFTHSGSPPNLPDRFAPPKHGWEGRIIESR